MAGYSGTPLPKKLGITSGCRLALFSAPETFLDALGALPDGVAVSHEVSDPADIIVAFYLRAADLKASLPRLSVRLASKGGLWVAWPKKASKVATDVTEGLVREVGLATGLVDNKVCAVDDVWSGLRFVHRRVGTVRS